MDSNSPESKSSHRSWSQWAHTVQQELEARQAQEGQTPQVQSLRILLEFIKEQVPHENTDSSARATR